MSLRRIIPLAPSTTATQATTYLLGICLFSISFLVFVNSSISFVVTDLLGRKHAVGSVVGTLGFADELVALAACPAWGLASDRLGVRWVAATGYAVVALGLVLLVHARSVYPGLLLARIFFAVGGAATATMVTATLPTLTHDTARRDDDGDDHGGNHRTHRPSVLAGYVGLFTGCGALVALALFLPLPTRFAALPPARAIEYSFYVVAAVAALVSLAVLVGLRGIPSEKGKGWRLLLGLTSHGRHARIKAIPYVRLVRRAVVLGFVDSRIALGYLGGFVARASTVAISLFIPLLVNTFFIDHGFCRGSPHDSSPELRKECREAYVLSSILTGVAQLVGLVCAPLFGHLAARWTPRGNWPVVLSAVLGILGYSALPRLASPEFRDVDGRGGSPLVFVVVSLIGISQIGCIVCSLGSLGRGVLATDDAETEPLMALPEEEEEEEEDDGEGGDDQQQRERSRVRLKGSIAGVYSLCGGAAILLLTKVGGLLFDTWSHGAPFYMMALFNAVLLAATLLVDASQACVQ